MQSSDCKRFTNLNFVTMDAKVKEFLEKKQAVEDAALLAAKHRLLGVLGLVERVEVEKDDEDCLGYYYDSEKGKYVYYKYVYPEITDEEYKKLKKYDPTLQKEPESNGESSLFTIASIYLALCVLGCLICLVMSADKGFILAVYGVTALVVGLITFWIVKVFTNISRKATAIYEHLKEQEK